MTPMFIQMTCIFCTRPLPYDPHHYVPDRVYLYRCKDCQQPRHKTMYKQQYHQHSKRLIADAIRIDNWYVLRRFEEINYSVIYSDILGVLNSSPDLEPITFKNEVCRLNYTLELPWHNIKLVKKKLSIYTTFS